jgi:hypothetical protein
MNFSDLPPTVKEAWDDKPGDVPFTSVGELFDRWCDYQGLIHWGPRIRHVWLELQRVQSVTAAKEKNDATQQER